MPCEHQLGLQGGGTILPFEFLCEERLVYWDLLADFH